jgi:thioredoxin-like negative regulator of GroEL
MPRPPHHLATLLLLATSLGAQVPAFAPGPLAAARDAAKAAQRALVIDFSHDAVTPCRRLRDETWPTADLWQALTPIADVIRVDPEVDTAAAAKFGVTAYPTIVVLGKDGAELGRLLGFVAASELRFRLVETIEPPPTKWEERENYAAALAKQKDLDGAGRHYLWIWDQAANYDTEFEQIRAATFLNRLARFAKRHPATMAELQERRQALLAKAGGAAPDHASMTVLVAMTRKLCDFDALLALRTAVPKATWDQHEYAFAELVDAVLPTLVKQRRFAEAMPFVPDPLAAFEHDLRYLGDMPEAVQKMVITSTVREQKDPLAVLFAAGDERAQQLADRLLERDGSTATWMMILGAAKAAGADVACHDWAVKALQTLPAKDHERVRSFLKRR